MTNYEDLNGKQSVAAAQQKHSLIPQAVIRANKQQFSRGEQMKSRYSDREEQHFEGFASNGKGRAGNRMPARPSNFAGSEVWSSGEDLFWVSSGVGDK